VAKQLQVANSSKKIQCTYRTSDLEFTQSQTSYLKSTKDSQWVFNLQRALAMIIPIHLLHYYISNCPVVTDFIKCMEMDMKK
jgi:hypothetical protein